MRTLAWGLFFLVLAAAAAGFIVSQKTAEPSGPVFSHGWQPGGTFDAAYARAAATPFAGAEAGLVAHHLLVADKIAGVFNGLASDDVTTVVIVSPNHFHFGIAPMQTTFGTYTTPYGDVAVDVDAVRALLDAVPNLREEAWSFTGEHGIAALTPFVKRSFPNAKLVPVILDDTLDTAAAWELGAAIARALPDALLIASVDMTHNRDAAFTAQNDAAVLAQLEQGIACAETQCVFDFFIDSNASLRTLMAFARARGATAWTTTHHGSSLEMGATLNPEENTSHILGFFSQAN